MYHIKRHSHLENRKGFDGFEGYQVEKVEEKGDWRLEMGGLLKDLWGAKVEKEGSKVEKEGAKVEKEGSKVEKEGENIAWPSVQLIKVKQGNNICQLCAKQRTNSV
jgi:hypothetical protein